MNRSKKDILIVLIFLFLSFICSAVLIKVGLLSLTSDSSFHFSRLEEIFQNLKSHHLFTFICAQTFNHSGVGSFLFYPAVFLYPWAFLRFFFNPVSSFFIWYGFMIFLTMVIAYYSLLDFSKNRTRSIIFALIYTFAPYHLHLGLYNYVLGEFIAYTFLPLIFLGAYHVFWKDLKKWPLLGIGMSLLLYSHILSTYLVSLFLFAFLIITLIVQKSIPIKRLISLFKSIVLCLLLSSFIIVPFLTDYIGKNILTPKSGFSYPMTMYQLFEPSISNTISINRSVGIIVIITALIGWYFAKKNTTEKSIYTIGVFFLITATTITPWQLAVHSHLILDIFGEIQFPYRLNAYSSFFLSVTASLIFEPLIDNLKASYLRRLAMIGFIFISIVMYYGSIQAIFDRISSVNGNYLTVAQNSSTPLPINALISKKNYNNIFSYLVLNGETDYYHALPTAKSAALTKSIYENQVFIGDKVTTLKPKTAPNKITYIINKKTNQQKNIDLPVIGYSRTTVSLNGKPVHYSISSRGTVKIKTSFKTNHISVSYKPSKLYYLSIFIAIISWICLFIFSFFKKINIFNLQIPNK